MGRPKRLYSGIRKCSFDNRFRFHFVGFRFGDGTVKKNGGFGDTTTSGSLNEVFPFSACAFSTADEDEAFVNVLGVIIESSCRPPYPKKHNHSLATFGGALAAAFQNSAR